MAWSTDSKVWLSCALLILAACGDGSGDDDGTAGEGAESGLPTTTASSSQGETDDGISDTGMTDGGDKLDMPAGDDGTAETGDECMQDVDIVFVMDVSTTMGPFLDKLEAEIDVVDQALQALDLPSAPHYGLVVFVDDTLITNAGAPYTDVAQLRTDFETWNNFTSGNSQVASGGSNTTWPENSIDALYLAGSVFQWRAADTTLRMIIHTTDDTFWNGPTTGNGIAIAHGFEETVDLLQSQQIRVFSYAALIGGSCNCEDVSMGWSTPYMGMTSMPEATGGAWFNIDEVLADQISLSGSIDASVIDTMCTPYPPPD